MSSQGPSTGSISASVGSIGCYGPTGTTQVAKGYTFSKGMIRDSSDWIRFKKEVAVYNAVKVPLSSDPWVVNGNDYRMTWFNGQYKCGPTGAGCPSDAFGATGSVANR